MSNFQERVYQFCIIHYIQNTDKEKHNKINEINEIELSKIHNLFVSQGWKFRSEVKAKSPSKDSELLQNKGGKRILCVHALEHSHTR